MCDACQLRYLTGLGPIAVVSRRQASPYGVARLVLWADALAPDVADRVAQRVRDRDDDDDDGEYIHAARS